MQRSAAASQAHADNTFITKQSIPHGREPQKLAVRVFLAASCACSRPSTGIAFLPLRRTKHRDRDIITQSVAESPALPPRGVSGISSLVPQGRIHCEGGTKLTCLQQRRSNQAPSNVNLKPLQTRPNSVPITLPPISPQARRRRISQNSPMRFGNGAVARRAHPKPIGWPQKSTSASNQVTKNSKREDADRIHSCLHHSASPLLSNRRATPARRLGDF
jgi:hypothetical protein